MAKASVTKDNPVSEQVTFRVDEELRTEIYGAWKRIEAAHGGGLRLTLSSVIRALVFDGLAKYRS